MDNLTRVSEVNLNSISISKELEHGYQLMIILNTVMLWHRC
jgi:hypothetical protein